MDEYKAWSKIKEQDRYCVFCGRKVEPWEGDFSVSRRKNCCLLAQRMLEKKKGKMICTLQLEL